jgi:broad specificity phosphatase PhoE
MKTTLYLLRHGATEPDLARPARLVGCRQDPPLTKLGIRQAEATRDFLAIRPIDYFFCSPMRRAVQTASIVAAPHGVSPEPVDALTACDVGAWEGLDWQTVRRRDPEGYAHFMMNPAVHGFPDGESFADVHARVSVAFEELWNQQAGASILVVGHHLVNQIYLAGLLGLSPDQAQLVKLDTCGISVICREDGATVISTLNAAFHLQGLAAA